MVHPPGKTARRRKSVCSSGVRKSWLQAIVLRIVCWRAGRVRAPPVNSGNRCSSRFSSAWGGSILTKAAASSIAKGNPSSREQISATAGALAVVTVKSGLTACARSMKSRTASYWLSASTDGR